MTNVKEKCAVKLLLNDSDNDENLLRPILEGLGKHGEPVYTCYKDNNGC